jgi:hypothetical protein
MSTATRKTLEKKIKDCRQLGSSKKVIKCLEDLFLTTNDGLVASDAVEYYERAEALFKQPIYKNMARAAINNLAIESLLAGKKKRRK